MATAKQLAALRKARAAKKTKSERGLGSILSLNNIKTGNLLKNLKNAGLVLAGFLVGKEGAERFIPVDPANPKSIKNYLGAAAQLGGGLVLASQKSETLQYLGVGLIGSGLLDGISKVTGKDLINEGIIKGLTGVGLNLAGLGSAALNLPELKAIAARDYSGDDEIEIIDLDEDYEDVED